MQNYSFFEIPIIRTNLYPLTFQLEIADLQVGMLTIREKWEFEFLNNSQQTAPHLYINGSWSPDSNSIQILAGLKNNQILKFNDQILAFRTDEKQLLNLQNIPPHWEHFQYAGEPLFYANWWHVFQQAALEIKADFHRVTNNRKSLVITDSATHIYSDDQVFVEEGAEIKGAIIDGSNGPVYIGKNTKINPGTVIRGSLALLEGSELSMGAILRGDSIIGPYCRVGGEVTNSVFLGYSNKAHHGYVGNSVIGQWCNLGAGTSVSNMKNDRSSIQTYNYNSCSFEDSQQPFLGMVLGNFTNCGIHSAFNSGSCIGGYSNLYNTTLHSNFVPAFSKGFAPNYKKIDREEVQQTAFMAYAQKGKEFSTQDAEGIRKVFELNASFE